LTSYITLHFNLCDGRPCNDKCYLNLPCLEVYIILFQSVVLNVCCLLTTFEENAGSDFVQLTESIPPNKHVPCISVKRCPTNAQGHCKQFFTVLIKLPRHVSASKCHLQGVTLSFFISFSSFLVCVSGRYGLLFTRCSHLLRNVPHTGTHFAADGADAH
jgi:hypothetical protein